MGVTKRDKAMAEVTSTPMAEIQEQFQTVDPSKVAVWERRMVNPGRESSTPILLKEEGWVVRWVDTSVPGRFQRATASQGWIPVRESELKDTPEMQGLVSSEDGFVRRGIRNQGMLMKMPEKVFRMVQRKKAELELKSLRKTRQSLGSALQKQYGGNSEDFVHGAEIDGVSGLKGRVIDSKERIVVGSEEDSF